MSRGVLGWTAPSCALACMSISHEFGYDFSLGGKSSLRQRADGPSCLSRNRRRCYWRILFYYIFLSTIYIDFGAILIFFGAIVGM